MKLIIQIPCYNEEKTLPETIKDLPDKIDGIDTIEYMVIDDGSVDRTAETAKSLGVHHIIRLKKNRGLAHAFREGIDACLELGADIVVNTDGDNQYCGADIPALVEPVIKGEADIVIGERPIDEIEHFSTLKKFFQKFGSAVVSRLAGIRVSDTTSGFRAFSRDALLKLNLISEYTYTLESIIQAGRKKIPLKCVSIHINPKTRDSRLIKNMFSYIGISAVTMIRVWLNYSALQVSIIFAVFFLLCGFGIGLRFIYLHYILGVGKGNLQSLILMAILVFTGFQLIIIGFLADLISGNKRLLEDSSSRIKSIESRLKRMLSDD